MANEQERGTSLFLLYTNLGTPAVYVSQAIKFVVYSWAPSFLEPEPHCCVGVPCLPLEQAPRVSAVFTCLALVGAPPRRFRRYLQRKRAATAAASAAPTRCPVGSRVCRRFSVAGAYYGGKWLWSRHVGVEATQPTCCGDGHEGQHLYKLWVRHPGR